ncbi:MAG: hypothetical protein J6I37_04420 [Prevotella sp.]|nr:hypothetical protein [Prevotella sp.]
MMKKTTNILRGRPWLLLLALFAWLLPQTAAADDNYETYVDQSILYNVFVSGTNTVSITVPCYDMEGADAWIYDGNLYASWEGQSELTLFHWASDTDIDNSKSTCDVTFSTEAPGYLNLKLGNTNNEQRLDPNVSSKYKVIRNDDKCTFSVSAVWVLPQNMLGKKVTLRWRVHRNGNSRKNVWLDEVGGLKNPDPITLPEANPVTPPFISFANINNDSIGKIMVPWSMIPEKISKLRYEYVDGNNRTVSKEVKTTSNSGIIMLNAYEPHRKFRLIADYYDPQTVGEYLIKDATSEAQDLTMLHAPHGLTVTPLGGAKPKVEVKWNIGSITDADLAEIDFFEIQRSLTGKEEDFVAVGQVPFARAGSVAQSLYTFVDSTYVNDIASSMLKDGYTLENLTYRVRRAMTQAWGWSPKNTCASTASCIVDNLHLLRIANYTATKLDDNYSVRVAWQYADEHNGVWDDRAMMMLRLTMKNAAGDTVEVKEIELNSEERQQCYKEIDLSRTCVKYDIEMYVDRNTSPINLFDAEKMKDYYFPIRSAEDWTKYRDMVQAAKGQYDVNARLYADISTGISIGWESDRPYRGTFDGNDHTLNFNINNSEQYVAPFRYVGNATIKNLHTAGTINTSVRYAAGLIGWTMEGATINIENCRSSVTLNSSVNGEGNLAGFIGRQSGSDVTIRNSKFDGSFEGDKATNNRGFVAWVARGSNLIIDNCVFAPDHISTSITGCQTWVGLDTQDVSYTNANSYAMKEYSALLTIRNASDWTKFVQMVEGAKNQYDVDAILAADISVSGKQAIAGYSGNYPYRGTLDGNGYTINVNISDNANNTALFSHVANATFKNLHLTGTVSSSSQHHGSLIGSIDANVTIENCRSSVTLKSSVNGDATMGGFVGVVNSNCSVTFSNCKFDGSFDGANTHSNGGFVGWANGPVTIENSLFAPERLNTKNENCETWRRGGSALTLTNSYATKEFGTETVTINGNTFMVLKSNADWMRFVEVLKTNPATNAIMDADFQIDTPADNFTGIFDGNGHTLDINFSNVTENMAIFKSATDYTIQNLRVTGKIWGGAHAATFVGASSRSGAVASKISNCRSSVLVQCNFTSGYVLGGFVGRGRGVDIVNCLFDGELWCNASDPWAGAFYGFVDGSLDGAVQSCLERATWSYINVKGLNIRPWTAWGNGENQWTYNNWSYSGVAGASHVNSNMSNETVLSNLGSDNWEIAGGWVVPKMFKTTIPDNPWATMSASEMVNILGSDNWEVVDGKAVPKAKTTTEMDAITESGALVNLATWTQQGNIILPTVTTTADASYATIVDPNLKDLFYHSGTGKIDKQLLVETRQSSVVLTWDTDGNPVDYFKVLRREVGNPDTTWVEIATNLDQMTYEDKTVSPLKSYEYMVRAMTDCEGNHHSDTNPTPGACKNTGRIEGYVRFNDGTGLPDVQVSITGGSVSVIATTDESGHYVADELPYQGLTNITYEVRAGSGVKAEVDAYSVTFDNETNDITVSEFTVINGKRFSGYVTYDGTSIPVKGANFLVNDHMLHGATGKPVETDEEGNFSFRVIGGKTITVQVVKDGHTFVNDGKYVHSFSGDVAQYNFRDTKKVKLIGRVVGGTDQGNLPLGNSLSKNNLGDDLQMVLALEGDTKSWLVRDVQHPEITERNTVYQHAGSGGHQTKVKTQRKRIDVTPDPVTGEYELLLPPVRWKVQQVYCTGYPTLFQNGQANDVIDLTDCMNPKDTTYVGSYKDVDGNTVYQPTASYNAIYNRIYRSPVELTYKQLNYDAFDYFGDKYYNATNLKGDKVQVALAYKNPDDSTTAKYTFGYPVFSLERKYYIQVQVAERYVYNNDLNTEKIDYVRVGGGVATMHNGMKNGVAVDTLHLNNLGQATFMVNADQITQPVGMENALKTVTFSAEQDGTYFETEPLHAYVLNLFPLSRGKDLLTDGQPMLFDILRDPPGAYSSATLAKGATLNNSYAMNLSMSGGVSFNFSLADKLDWFTGDVDGDYIELTESFDGEFDGVQHGSEKVDVNYSELVFNYNGSKAWSHTMVLSDAVSTSGDPLMVGADADLYIGQVQNVQVKPMSSIRAVTDSVYKARLAQTGIGQVNTKGDVTKYSKYATLVHIAEGTDADGKKFHLVRDVSLGYGPKIKSNFIYSQKQILEEIIPGLAGEILNKMFIGSKADAQALANSTHQPVYRSLRTTDDPKFALPNKQYNTTIETANDSTHYIIVLPTGKEVGDFNDEVSEKGEIIYAWTKMITQNEREKLNATDLVNSFDIAGAQGVNYSETFSSSYSNSTSMYFPYGVQPDYFAGSKGNGTGTISSIASTITNYIGGAFFGYLESFKKLDPTVSNGIGGKGKEGTASVNFDGKYFRWSLTPVLSSTTIGTNSQSKEFNRTASFTIAAAPTSRLSVDVYRVPMADVTGGSKYDMEDVFTNYNFDNVTNETLDYLKRETNIPDHGAASSFVFRTRGGYTSNPWEDQRKTRFYQAGSILDERTLKIDNPTISLDKHSVSGVSVNDPARFTVFLGNESEKPEATGGVSAFTLFSVDQANPNGAKLSVNGQTLTTSGMSVSVVPGMTTQLELEVRAGNGFDYNGLTIGVMSAGDPIHTTARAQFDVHFLREAGAVSISAPADKWVLNTTAQKDSLRGWYIPITISGFDRHQHNFDHIEFQYKETQRGDDTWTNLCSYYADSTLMANANGVCELMKPNDNIVTQFYGEGWEIERSYDLRAVLFCRNGGTFLTSPSKVISGVKDTRRPQLFGTPEPKSGLLNMTDNIVFNFSEDIEYNNLSDKTNFEVKGEVNNNDFSEMVSLQFTGQASVETDAKRNFSGKDLTIDLRVKPAETNRDMPLFSHGSNGQKLQLWLTNDYKLKAVVNDQTFVSEKAIEKNAFTQVAVSINQQDSTLWLYSGGEDIGMAGKPYKLNSLYSGTGPLIFGRTNDIDRSKSEYYEGRMMEARLWYRTMSSGLVSTYSTQRLTGYEKGLVDYYPMNEGSGDYVMDYTQGANAKLIGTNWAMPHGMSLHVDKEDKGVGLTDKALNRSAEQDYTLMFWFKTDADGCGTLLANGRGLKEDDGAQNQFHIGFEGDKLMYRSNGYAIEIPGNWSDGDWHHYAMTVNRSRNVANIYMDKELMTTFAPDSLGGISGGKMKIGATRYAFYNEKDSLEIHDGINPMKGNIDELIVFAQALPETLIKTYATKSPSGETAGLLTYLSFDQQERNADNEIVMTPYVYSKKIYLDDQGNVKYQQNPETNEFTTTPVRDYLFVDDIDKIMAHVSDEMAAPVVPNENVTNLNFSFIGKGNQVLINLDEPAAKVHHRNIYVTLRDIEDKNGNTMASPQTACYYVTNSSLQWMVNRLDTTIKYGSSNTLELPFYNNGATSHNYTIENCPRWITLNKYSDVVAPQTLDYVNATVSKDLNIGTYNEIIYLTDEEGISEPFYLNLTVEGEQPDWAQSINGELLQHSMSISGQVYLYNELDTDSRDIVGVFDNENVCHGYANISYSAQTGENGLFLTVYDNQANGRELKFRLWQYSTGREIVLTTTPTITFTKDAILGADTPVRFDGGDSFVQNFSLNPGWNWVSFNISSKQLEDVNTLLKNMTWTNGDILTDMNSNLTLVYENGEWQVSGTPKNEDGTPKTLTISPKSSYAIKVQKDCDFPIDGTVITEKEERTIQLEPGWNGIGYTPTTNLTVETALSDYYDYAEEGDVIKSHTEFAYFSKSGSTGHWRGSLKYMKPGEGYMLLRKGVTNASFTYPFYEPNSNFREDWSDTNRAASSARRTMSVSAVIEGFYPEEGDSLVAYAAGGEKCGMVSATDEVLYMSIGGEAQAGLWFTIERDGEVVAATTGIMDFRADAVVGSPDDPAKISFEPRGNDEGKWYTIGGILLPNRPTAKGVYIHNGKKVVIK